MTFLRGTGQTDIIAVSKCWVILFLLRENIAASRQMFLFYSPYAYVTTMSKVI